MHDVQVFIANAPQSHWLLTGEMELLGHTEIWMEIKLQRG